MSLGHFALQEKVYATLDGDSNLTSTVGAAIYDEVPENSAFPYIVIGEDSNTSYDTKSQSGSQVTLVLHVWSQYKGNKEVDTIMDRVHTLLHDTGLSVTGFNLINLRYEAGNILRDPDGITRHGVMRFRAVMLGTA